MKFARSGAAVSLLAAGTLVLTACGGGTNSSSSGAGGTSGSVHCGGKKELHSSGSTAQENAMEQFVYAYVRSCPGYVGLQRQRVRCRGDPVSQQRNRFRRLGCPVESVDRST